MMRQHGTRSCYVGGCRRPECVEANRRYHTDRIVPLSAGERMIPAGPFAEVARAVWRQVGSRMTFAEVAAVAHVTPETLRRFVYGDPVRVRIRTAAKLRSLTVLLPPEPLP